MKRFSFLLLCTSLPGALLAASPLQEATFTEVINDVRVLPVSTKNPVPAKLSDAFKTPDVLRTAANSLAELTAADNTITRIGANTAFSFDPQARTLNLQQGSVLFHSPKGKGGGTIKTGGASASVLGTTLIVTTTLDGGFKAIVLEGKGKVQLPNGAFRILRAGQLVFVLPGSQSFGPLLNVNLEKLVRSARLVNGFKAKLPSLERIEVEVERQNKLIASGQAEDTKLLVGNSATQDKVSVVDTSLLERALVSETPLQIALRTDALINTSVLDPKHLFLDPFQLTIPNVSRTTWRGFVARDITITTPSIILDDFTSGGHPYFDMLAVGKIDIHNSVDFFGNASNPYEFTLGTIGGISIAPGSTLTASGLGNFHIVSTASMDFDSINFRSLSGGIRLDSAHDVAFLGGPIGGSINGSFVEIEGLNVNILGTLANPYFGTSFDYIDIFAENNITIDRADLIGSGPSSVLFMTPGNTLDVRNTFVSGFSFISMQARTVVLQNIDFPLGSTVQLQSQNGLLAPNPNLNQPVQNGFVNYISGVTYGGGNPVGNPNITISARP